MNVIIDFFKGIGDAVVTAVRWLGQMIADLVYIAELLGEFIKTIPSYFSWIPPAALIILGSLLAIVVIYKLLGREG